MASVAEIANELVSLCGQGQFMQAVEKLYGDDVVSIEPVSMPNFPARQEGIAAIKGKNQWWADNHEIHSSKLKGPFVGDGQFAVHFDIDVTQKFSGQRVQMSEMALYTVKNGKITQEEFYYNVPGA